jgi:hypothetical protein
MIVWSPFTSQTAILPKGSTRAVRSVASISTSSGISDAPVALSRKRNRDRLRAASSVTLSSTSTIPPCSAPDSCATSGPISTTTRVMIRMTDSSKLRARCPGDPGSHEQCRAILPSPGGATQDPKTLDFGVGGVGRQKGTGGKRRNAETPKWRGGGTLPGQAPGRGQTRKRRNTNTADDGGRKTGRPTSPLVEPATGPVVARTAARLRHACRSDGPPFIPPCKKGGGATPLYPPLPQGGGCFLTNGNQREAPSPLTPLTNMLVLV